MLKHSNAGMSLGGFIKCWFSLIVIIIESSEESSPKEINNGILPSSLHVYKVHFAKLLRPNCYFAILQFLRTLK
jgi:hypothetical protein